MGQPIQIGIQIDLNHHSPNTITTNVEDCMYCMAMYVMKKIFTSYIFL